MNRCLMDLNRPRVSELEIITIAIQFLFDGRSMSECRGQLLSEYDVNPDELTVLMEEAQGQVRACEVEFGNRLRF